MGPNEVRLVFFGILIGVVVVGGIIAANYLLKNFQLTTSLLSQLPINKQITPVQLTGVLSKAAGSSSVNVSYSGYLKLKENSGSSVTTVSVNVSGSASRSGNSSTLALSYVVPSSYSNSQTNYTETLLMNGTKLYFCGPSLSYVSYLYKNSSCVDGPTIAILENTSYNYTLAFFNLMFLNGFKMRITNATGSSISGKPCTLVNGTFGGSLPAYQVEQAISSLSGYGLSVYPNYVYGQSQNATFGGTFKACISNKYIMPLTINASAKITGFQQNINAQLFLQAGPVTSFAPLVSPDTLPSRLLNLSAILVGSCYQSYIYGIGYGPSIGSCTNPIMNTTGTIKANFTNYNIYYPQSCPYGYPCPTVTPARILGLACTQTPQYGYPYTITTTIYPGGTQAPPSKNFTAVNITMSAYGNTTLYFNCPAANTKIGAKFYGTLWLYYKQGSFSNVTSYTVSTYVTAPGPLGSNVNTGKVNPLPSTFPNQTRYVTPSITISSTGSRTNGAYNTGDILSWYGYVTPYAPAQLSIVYGSTNSVITFTPNSQASSSGYVSSSFPTENNIMTGLNYLKIVDLTSQKSAQTTFTKS